MDINWLSLKIIEWENIIQSKHKLSTFQDDNGWRVGYRQRGRTNKYLSTAHDGKRVYEQEKSA